MITLHIEHPISDFGTWRHAFDGFAVLRHRSGVRSHTIRQPVDDPRYVLIDLDFDTIAQAEHFLDLLRSRVWANRDDSPALTGAPITRILEIRDTTTRDAGWTGGGPPPRCSPRPCAPARVHLRPDLELNSDTPPGA